jgi:FPC/CPF motif-containing protein YcgG
LIAFVRSNDYPCLGSKAAINAAAYDLHCYSILGDGSSSNSLAADLCQFADSSLVQQHDFATFIAIFRSPPDLDEVAFEEALWRTLTQLHEIDARRFDWDASVSSDPSSGNFAFSFAGRAFYVVGLHPHSSRISRRFPYPALVFNLHAQFQKLRVQGKWERMRTTIRERDLALQGTNNPMLTDFGEFSEARQYSGRAVNDKWTAPFTTQRNAPHCPFTH